MDYYDLEKPYRKGKWIIFPNATVNKINLSDCNDTVTGTCLNTDTIDECMNFCDKHAKSPGSARAFCNAGYFIKTKRGNYCVPVREFDEPSVPYHRLRNRSFYPETADLDTQVYIDSEKFPYPPDKANAIFYTDHFIMTNNLTGLSIGSDADGNILQKVTFTKDSPIHIQLLPKNLSQNFRKLNEIVRNGDEVVLNIPDTAMVMRNIDNTVVWSLSASGSNIPQNTFRIFAKNKPLKVPLSFDDDIYFSFSKNAVVHNNTTSEINIIYKQPAEAVIDENVLFKFIPEIKVYYCENNTCKGISLSNTTTNDISAKYNGNPVSRMPGCIGLCNNPRGKKHHWVIFFIIAVVLVSLLVLLKLYLSNS